MASKALLIVILLVIIAVGLYFVITAKNNVQNGAQNANRPADRLKKISQPIDNAAGRITKKPFGIEVAPGNSPVSPERFHFLAEAGGFEPRELHRFHTILIFIY